MKNLLITLLFFLSIPVMAQVNLVITGPVAPSAAVLTNQSSLIVDLSGVPVTLVSNLTSIGVVAGNGVGLTNVTLLGPVPTATGNIPAVNVNTNAATGLNFGATAILTNGVDSCGRIIIVTSGNAPENSGVMFTNIFSAAFQLALSNTLPIVNCWVVGSPTSGLIQRTLVTVNSTNGWSASWQGAVLPTSSQLEFQYTVMKP